MNLLIIYSREIDPLNGGVERSSKILSEYFEQQGDRVYFLSFSVNKKKSKQQFELPNKQQILSQENFIFFQKLISDYQINIILNQDGKNVRVCEFIWKAKNPSTKVVSVIHNSIFREITIGKKNHFKKFAQGIWNKLYTLKYKKHFSHLYKNSHTIVTLSEMYKADLERIVKNITEEKIVVLNNPSNMGGINPKFKSKTVLYVGRLDIHQKRLDFLLHIWKIIEEKNNDWTLKIIGDGPNKEDLLVLKENLKLNRCEFLGKTNPEKYYKRSTFFCLTSAYEGQPMSIIEAMQNGTVPIIMNSFREAKNMIKNDFNGYLIDYGNINEFAKILLMLMDTDQKQIKKLSINAINSSEKYNPKVCGAEWRRVLIKE